MIHIDRENGEWVTTKGFLEGKTVLGVCFINVDIIDMSSSKGLPEQLALRKQNIVLVSCDKKVIFYGNVVVKWGKISVEECQKWIESMPRMVEAVIKAKGAHTKY